MHDDENRHELTAGDLANLPVGIPVLLPDYGVTVTNYGSYPYAEEWAHGE